MWIEPKCWIAACSHFQYGPATRDMPQKIFDVLLLSTYDLEYSCELNIHPKFRSACSSNMTKEKILQSPIYSVIISNYYMACRACVWCLKYLQRNCSQNLPSTESISFLIKWIYSVFQMQNIYNRPWGVTAHSRIIVNLDIFPRNHRNSRIWAINFSCTIKSIYLHTK
jgi:hypothetical protein